MIVDKDIDKLQWLIGYIVIVDYICYSLLSNTGADCKRFLKYIYIKLSQENIQATVRLWQLHLWSLTSD